uniref:MIP-T3 domain-containing protein n=2 Tax=Macrostomum lignano TaxID=282301 RepID=A0A1I8ISQ7_9PLAT
TDKHRSAAPVDEALPALRSSRLPHWLSEFADRRRRAKFLETMERLVQLLIMPTPSEQLTLKRTPKFDIIPTERAIVDFQNETRNKVGNAQPTLQTSTPGTSNRKNRPDLPFKKSTVPFEKLSQLEKRCRMQMQPSLVPTAQTPSARQSMAVTQSPNPDTVDTGRLRLLASKKATRRSSVPQAKSSASGPQIPQLHCATAGRRQKGPPGAWQDGRDLLAVGDAQAERLLAAASGGARAEKRTAGPPEVAQLQQLPAGGQTPHPASSIAASGEHFVSIQAAVTGNKGRSEARASQLGTLAPLSHRRGSRVRALEQSRCAVGGAAQQQAGVTAAADGAGSPAAMSQRRSGGSSRRCSSAPAAAAVRSSAAAAAGVGGDCRCRSFEQDLTAAASAAPDVCLLKRGRVHQVNAQRCDRQEAPPGQAETTDLSQRQGSHSRSGLRAECRSGPGSRSFQLASRQAAPRQLSIVAVIAEANNGQSAGSGAEVQQVGLGQSGGGESGGAEHRGPVQQLSAMMTFFVFVVLDAIIAAAQAPQLKGAIVGDCQQAIVGQVDGEEPGIGEERQTVGDSSSSRYSLPTFHGIAAGVVICALVQVPQGHVILSLASQKSWRYPIEFRDHKPVISDTTLLSLLAMMNGESNFAAEDVNKNEDPALLQRISKVMAAIQTEQEKIKVLKLSVQEEEAKLEMRRKKDEADAAQAEKETAEQLMQKHRKLVELTKQNAELQTKYARLKHQVENRERALADARADSKAQYDAAADAAAAKEAAAVEADAAKLRAQLAEEAAASAAEVEAIERMRRQAAEAEAEQSAEEASMLSLSERLRQSLAETEALLAAAKSETRAVEAADTAELMTLMEQQDAEVDALLEQRPSGAEWLAGEGAAAWQAYHSKLRQLQSESKAKLGPVKEQLAEALRSVAADSEDDGKEAQREKINNKFGQKRKLVNDD